jgi:hypothetical protein
MGTITINQTSVNQAGNAQDAAVVGGGINMTILTDAPTRNARKH